MRRELETAPLLLRKASQILLVGAITPWLTALTTAGAMPWKAWAIATGLALAAGWVMVESAKATSGLPANGLVKPIAGAHPLAGPIFGLALFIGGVVSAFMSGADGFGIFSMLEQGTILLALGTFAHILRYEYGGKFNPIFPLMFAGPAVAGTLNALRGATAIGDNQIAIISVLGSLAVAAGGIYAMYTMVVSMKQAKLDGDIKRAEERERRKEERSARRTSQ